MWYKSTCFLSEWGTHWIKGWVCCSHCKWSSKRCVNRAFIMSRTLLLVMQLLCQSSNIPSSGLGTRKMWSKPFPQPRCLPGSTARTSLSPRKVGAVPYPRSLLSEKGCYSGCQFVCGNQPKSGILSSLDSPLTLAISVVRVWGLNIPVQGRALRSGPFPHFFTNDRDAALAPLQEEGVCVLN